MAIDQTKITMLRAQIDRYQTELTRAQTLEETLAKQKTELEAEAAALGVPCDESAIRTETERLESEAAAALAEAERLLAEMAAPAGMPGGQTA